MYNNPLIYSMIYSVEGNIGSGKSTFVQMLKEHFSKNHKPNRPIIFLQEPVDEWHTITDKNGESILSKFYADQKKYSFAFQMMAYISRLALLKRTVEENPDAIIITERCLYTDKNVFAKMLYDSGLIEEVEYSIYLRWFDNFQTDYPISGYIYLHTDPKTAYERVKKRNREGEDIIPLDYLSQCHQYHENWLAEFNTNLLKINAEYDIPILKQNIPYIEKFIQEKI